MTELFLWARNPTCVRNHWDLPIGEPVRFVRQRRTDETDLEPGLRLYAVLSATVLAIKEEKHGKNWAKVKYPRVGRRKKK
uniref:Uncharacterized protein n=1 Tax=viral metagenome TaxID=1070528 RepID=A0A6M3JK79_9ZZZZ